MSFLATIEEDDEYEELLQKPERGGQKDSDELLPHGISKVRYELDSESYEAIMAYSEKDQISQAKHGDSSTSLAPVALKEPRKLHKLLSSSTQKRRNSTARSPHRKSSSTPGSSQRRLSSAQSSPYSSAPDEDSRSHSLRRMSGSVVGKSDARRITSSKRTRKKAPSTASRRRPHGHPNPEHDALPAPQWVINLMFDIEAATSHELTVE